MKSYLVIHFDIEFIARTVCTGDGHPYPLKKGDEELLWLYFFNDPYQNRVTFSRDNKKHVNNIELNYYGDFINKITDPNEKFVIRGIQRPLIELLENSGLLKILADDFRKKSLDDSPQIPTLITFSSSIRRGAKQMIIDYLSSKNFQIESSIIPLPELISFYYKKEGKIILDSSKVVLFLEATNSTLHLLKLNFIDGYLLNDKNVSISYVGKGADPRKKAITKFVVSQVNLSTGVLSNPDEIEKECERFELSAEDWLRRLDASGDNKPINIQGISLSPAINMRREILVRKADIQSDTNVHISELISAYKTFENSAVKEKKSIAAVILIGDCFTNDLIEKFDRTIKDKLLLVSINKLQEIISVHVGMEFQKMGNENERIKLSEEFKNKEEERKNRIGNTSKAEALLEKAKNLFETGNLIDGYTIIKKAKELDPFSIEIKEYFDFLNNKKIAFDVQISLCNEHILKADEFKNSGKLREALDQLELAEKINSSKEIKNSIKELKDQIKAINDEINREKNEKAILEHLDKATILISEKKYSEAKNVLNNGLKIDNQNQKIIDRIIEVDIKIKYQESEFERFKGYANTNYENKEWDKAEQHYNHALKIKPGDQFCTAKLKDIANIRMKEIMVNEELELLIRKANDFFEHKDWQNAELYILKGLELKPSDKESLELLSKITQLKNRISKETEEFESIIKNASDAFNNGDWDNAEVLLRLALTKRANDENCILKLEEIAKLRIDLGKKDHEFQKLTSQASHQLETGDYELALSSLEMANKIKPNDQYCLQEIAKIKLRVKEKREKEDKVEIILRQASQCMLKGELDQATKLYKEALVLHPGNEDSLLKLDLITDILNRELEENYEQTIKQALEYVSRSDWHNAEKFFGQALDLKPGDIICLEQLTRISEEYEKNKKLHEEFELIINQASECFLKGDLDQSKELYEKSLAIKPSEKLPVTQLNKIVKLQEENIRKEKEFESHLKLASDNFEEGAWTTADSYYKKALDIKPNNAICLAQIAKIAKKEQDYDLKVKQAFEFFNSGDWDNSEELYRNALTIKIKDKYCLKQLEKISAARNRENKISKPLKPKKFKKVIFEQFKNIVLDYKKWILAGVIVILLLGFGYKLYTKDKAVISTNTQSNSNDKKSEKDSFPDNTNSSKTEPKSSPEETKKNEETSWNNGEMPTNNRPVPVQNVLTFKNGNYYRGEISNGKMHGVGTYIFKFAERIKGDDFERKAESGDSIVGKWRNGDLVQGEHYSKGSFKEKITLLLDK